MESGQVQLLAEMGAVLASSESREARAAQVLEQLRAVVPYAAGCISAVQVGRIEHVTLANGGYPPHVEDHLNGWFVEHDPAYLLMRRSGGPPLRWRDYPFPYRQTYSVQEMFAPAGFDEGITVCMHNRRGHYTGSLHLSVADRQHPTDAAVSFLCHLRTMLGELTDLGGGPPAAVTGADVLRLSAADPGAGRPVPPELVQQVRAMAAQGPLPSWFWWQDLSGEIRLVTVERVGNDINLTETVARLPYDISGREMEVLTLIAAGFTNTQIAHRLRISPKTVAKHIEHTLTKMGARSRTEAAVRATCAGMLLRSATLPLSVA